VALLAFSVCVRAAQAYEVEGVVELSPGGGVVLYEPGKLERKSIHELTRGASPRDLARGVPRRRCLGRVVNEPFLSILKSRAGDAVRLGVVPLDVEGRGVESLSPEDGYAGSLRVLAIEPVRDHGCQVEGTIKVSFLRGDLVCDQVVLYDENDRFLGRLRGKGMYPGPTFLRELNGMRVRLLVVPFDADGRRVESLQAPGYAGKFWLRSILSREIQVEEGLALVAKPGGAEIAKLPAGIERAWAELDGHYLLEATAKHPSGYVRIPPKPQPWLELTITGEHEGKPWQFGAKLLGEQLTVSESPGRTFAARLSESDLEEIREAILAVHATRDAADQLGELNVRLRAGRGTEHVERAGPHAGDREGARVVCGISKAAPRRSTEPPAQTGVTDVLLKGGQAPS
jgi:hypothetical protein